MGRKNGSRLARTILRAAPSLAAFALLAASIAVAGRVLAERQSLAVELEARQKLLAVAALKVTAIEQWRGERLADAEAVTRTLAAPGAVLVSDEAAGMLRRFAAAQGYVAAALVDRAGNVLRGGLPAGPLAAGALAANAACLAGALPCVGELFSDASGRIWIDTLAPLAEGGALRFVLLRSDPERALFPIVDPWPTTSRTAETVLARREGDEALVLNHLRAEPGAALRRRLPLTSETPTAQTLRGAQGDLEGPDYRGVPVLAVGRPISGSQWSLVTKIDRAEVDAVSEEARRPLLAATAGIVAAVAALLWGASRRRAARFYRRAWQAERAASALREHQAHILDTVRDAVLGIGRDHRIHTWNRAAEEMYGWTAEEAIGRDARALIPTELDGVGLEEAERELAEKGTWRSEARQRRKDGSAVEVEVVASLARTPGGGVVVVNRDLAEQRRSEARARELQARLAVADRLSSVGVLAAGVAHEINNPLAYVLSNVEYVRRELDEPAPDASEVRAALDEAREGGERVRQIVLDLKALSRAGGDADHLVRVEKVVASAVRIARAEIRHRARLVEEIGALPWVSCSEHRLGQVVLNLLVNAAQAIPEGDPSTNQVTIRAFTRDGEVVLQVEDSGCGMAPEVRARIFEPFFTTKPEGVGTGLGLAICAQIVSAAGGRIEVESAPGRGSVFSVYLPAARGQGGAREAIERHRTRRGRVLVVDDDALVARAVERALSDVHDVTVVHDGQAALDLLAAPEAFDAAICDLLMPSMSGMQLHAELARRSPETARRVIFLSGATGAPSVAAFLESVRNRHLAKPFDQAELRELVDAHVRAAA